MSSASTGTPPYDYPAPAAMRDLWEAFDANFDTISRVIREHIATIPSLATRRAGFALVDADARVRRNRELLRGAALEGRWEPLHAYQREQGATYAAMGVPFGAWCALVNAYQGALIPLIADRHPDEPARATRALMALHTYVNMAIATVAESYLAAKERIISEQGRAIQELSTPVLRISDRLLLLPLVGIVDTQRARMMTEQLLQAVRKHRARVVVIDITGVLAVDSKVAQHLIQTIAAARMMGALSIITGLSAEVAQALVALGVDTTGLNTVGDLQGGLEDAHRRLGERLCTVAPLPAADDPG